MSSAEASAAPELGCSGAAGLCPRVRGAEGSGALWDLALCGRPGEHPGGVCGADKVPAFKA